MAKKKQPIETAGEPSQSESDRALEAEQAKTQALANELRAKAEAEAKEAQASASTINPAQMQEAAKLLTGLALRLGKKAPSVIGLAAVNPTREVLLLALRYSMAPSWPESAFEPFAMMTREQLLAALAYFGAYWQLGHAIGYIEGYNACKAQLEAARKAAQQTE